MQERRRLPRPSTPFDGTAFDPPEYGWFDREAGARVPDVFPAGLPATVPDPELEWLRDRILRIERPVSPAPPATAMVEIIETWTRDPVRALSGAPVRVAVAEAFRRRSRPPRATARALAGRDRHLYLLRRPRTQNTEQCPCTPQP